MFAERLKELRKKNGYTQVSLAEALGVSKGTVAMWETGKRTPDFDKVNELSVLFDRRMDYILGYSDDETSPKLTEEDIEQLGKWELEDQFTDIIKMYLSLDEFGKSAVNSLIKEERLRCHDQKSILDTSDIKVSLRIK